MNPRRLGATLGIAAMMLIATSCSGDDSASTDSSATTGSTQTTVPGNTTPDAAASTTAAPSGTPTTDDGTTDGTEPVPTNADGSVTSDGLAPLDSEPADTDPPQQLKLPADGPATVGGVALPAGSVLLAGDQRLTWITDEPVPGAAATWKQLWDVREQTGLYPVLLYNDDQPAGWEVDSFFPNQPFELDNMDLVEVLESAAELNFDPPRTFNGLAAASSGPEDVAAADALVAALPDTRIALVESPRGADALSYMGWTGNATYDSTEAIATAVRSWEERYGVRVVAVGPTSLTLAVTHPPTAAETALLSEELGLLDPDLEAGTAPIPVVPLGDGLAGQQLWTLWWA